MTSCKSTLDKSISETLSREEMVSICKDRNLPNLEKIITSIGSKESLYRELDEAFLIKYSDLTYRDIIEYWELVNDSIKIKEFDAKYDEYDKAFCDSVWTKLTDIRENIKNDTSFNHYAKLSYQSETVKSFVDNHYFKRVFMQVDSYEKDVDALGGIVSKVSKDGNSIDFNYFELSKRRSELYVKRSPTSAKDTLDYYSGEYDYSINILWIKKGRQIFQTSEEIWDNLVKNSTHKSNFSIWGTYTSDMVFSKSTIKKDDQLLKITKSKRRSRKEFRASLFEEQMTEKNLRAKKVVRTIPF